ncbi:cytochrome P450 [Frankia sp. CcI6]|uniref:cytochrome P450 n=1 Tax=Frankia sp. CcI6 TaxID=1352929 RepID=UPI0003CFA1C7|nr:cytochrome P450 [Frankia sp. CcI6]ETA00973.1 cytochrome P450 [Frankia sp. CcI6]
MNGTQNGAREGLPPPMVTIKIPAAFRALSGGQRQVAAKGENIREVFADLNECLPGLIDKIMDGQGSVRRYINVYRNDNDIRGLENLETRVEESDVVWIIPAVAGGSIRPAVQEPKVPEVLPSEFFLNPGPSPHATNAELRSKCPVHQINYPPGSEAYAVLGHRAVAEAFTDSRLSKEAENLPPRFRDRALSSSLLMVRNLGFADPPDHARLRRPISRAFLPNAIADLRPRIQDVVDDLIDTFPAPGEIDLLGAFALPLPLTVICEYLGIPVQDRPLFLEWGYILSQDPFQHAESELKAATEEFTDYFTRLVARRRTDLRKDLLSELVRAADSDALSERELLSTILLLLIAGHKTVANLIGNGTALLLGHPGQLDLLRTTPELIPAAVEEMLRFEGSAAWASMRVAVEDMRLAGTEIPRGSFVHLSLSSAGHDPEAYDEPERFDVTRSPNHHLAFGHGAHFCVGAPLGRLQGDIAFTTLLRRLPGFELAVRQDEVEWLADSSLSRGLRALPIRVRERLPR